MGIHYPEHPLCRHLPKMDDDDLQKLADDIEKNGQRLPIILFRGRILDGRHRRNACILRGIEPQYETFQGTFDEAKNLVVSLNEHRRHMTTSQRALTAAGWDEVKDEDESGDGVVITTPDEPKSQTVAEAAEAWNVNRDTVFRAKKVLRTAAPEVTDEIKQGRMTINKAGKFTAVVPDKAEQAEIVKAGRVDEVLKKALPPEEPPALPKTNTLHIPATQQRVDRGPDPAPPTVIECGAGLTPLQHILAQHTRREVLMELVCGYEGEQRKRVFADIRAFLDEFDPQPIIHDATEKPAKRGPPAKHPTADQLMFVAEPYATKWSGQLMTQVCKWAEYKQSLAGNAKVRSLASWDAMLTRIDNVQKMRGPGTVCEMINKAIANGWQGWEHDSGSNGKPTVASTRIDSGEDYSDLEYRTA